MKIILFIILTIIIIFISLRFLNLSADFPSGITTSTALYSDEGFYSNAAINYIITGNWYKEGDFNPAVNEPITPIIQTFMFNIMGMSLTTARVTIVIFSIFLIILLYLLTLKFTNKFIAILSCFIMSTNYFIFAYSRLAIPDIIMTFFAVLSILLALSYKNLNDIKITTLSAFILVIAALTKNTAIFILPILIFISFKRGNQLKDKILLASTSFFVFVLIFFSYNVFMSIQYPEDFLLFRNINFDLRVNFAPLSIIRNFIYALRQAIIIGPIIYPLIMISSLILFTFSKEFRKNILVQISFLWFIFYFLILSITPYHPSRYFLPLVVPLSVLFSLFIGLLLQSKKRAWIIISIIILIFLPLYNGYKIIRYTNSPHFTLINMINNVKQLIDDRSRDNSRVILLGDLSNTISLETGIESINSEYGTRPLSWRIKNYRPQFYISLGGDKSVIKILNNYYKVDKLSEWNVFGNYSLNKKVMIFRLEKNR